MLLLAQESVLVGGLDIDLVIRRDWTGRDALGRARFSVPTNV